MIDWNLIGIITISGVLLTQITSSICNCVVETQRFKYLMENKELLKNISDIKVISSDKLKEFENANK